MQHNSSVFSSRDSSLKSQSASSVKRNAFLASGISAIAYGIVRRDRFTSPLFAGGALLLYGAAREASKAGTSFEVSYTINRPPNDVYTFIKDLNNWPSFMKGLQNPHIEDSQTITWNWESGQRRITSKILNDLHGERICWRSTAANHSSEFVLTLSSAPGNRGTELHCRVLRISGASLLRDLFGSALGMSVEQQTRESFRAAKQLMETGEIPITDGQPHGRRGVKGKASRIVLHESVDEMRHPVSRSEPPGNERAAL
jgi:uncharacterized membrane protein